MTFITIHKIYQRRGSAMLVTMLVTTAVVAILFVASEHTRANTILTNMADDRLRASLAAESVAALVESKLVGRAAETENLTKNVQQDPALWWNLVGCSYTTGSTTVIPERGLWMNGCVVRWRIEPVKIGSIIDTQSIASDATYTVNREIDPARVQQRETAAQAASNGGSLLAGNPPFFHYRIVAEAYALKNPTDVAAAPWSESGKHTVSVQIQRVVQLNLINLFDYAVFYGAKGATGDLEFEPEFDTNMTASMHSNGAIFFGGSGTSFNSKDYKKSASNGGTITLGDHSDKVQISGVMGVFRMRKSANVFFASPAGNDDTILLSPFEVPRPGKKVKGSKKQSVMSGKFDLNGGDGNPATEKVAINGEKFTFYRDSRSDWSLPENRLDPYVKDAKSGGTAITSLASIPEFAGYPLEPQRLVGEQIPLYRTIDDERFTVNPGRTPAQALYYSATGDVTTTSDIGSRMIYATDMPLFRFIDSATGKAYEDVWPNQPIVATSSTLAPVNTEPLLNAPVGLTPPNQQHTWLPQLSAPGTAGVVLGYYLEKSLFGEEGATTTGLTIRERGRQNTAFRWVMNGETELNASGVVSTEAPVPTNFSDPASYIRAHVAWLKSMYVVYLGRETTGMPRDITDEFFAFGSAAAQASGLLEALVASQDRFVDRREAHWLQDHGYFSAANNIGLSGEDSARTLRARPLTLHLARVCNFLRTGSVALGGNTPATVFNGLIYIHRTPHLSQVAGREGSYDALAPWRYHPISERNPLAPDAISNTAHDFIQIGSVTPMGDAAIGKPGCWALYPLHLPVRINQAEAIDWGATNLAGGPQGLIVVTPNACYVQGSFNTVAAANGKFPPSAIYADSLTLLSNNWSDAANDQDDDFTGPLPLASDTNLNASLVLNNLPTDDENVTKGGSGGVHNLVRYLENWNSRTMQLHGSLVVLNRMRYTRSTLNKGTNYEAPQRHFIPDLGVFTEAGKPPFSPCGIKVTRMVSTIFAGAQ
jgi:hypothetical protein